MSPRSTIDGLGDTVSAALTTATGAELAGLAGALAGAALASLLCLTAALLLARRSGRTAARAADPLTPPVVEALVLYARLAAVGGHAALAGPALATRDPFLGRALRLVSEGREPARVRRELESAFNDALPPSARVRPAPILVPILLAVVLLAVAPGMVPLLPNGDPRPLVNGIFLALLFAGLAYAGSRLRADAGATSPDLPRLVLSRALIIEAAVAIGSGETENAVRTRLHSLLPPAPAAATRAAAA